MNDTMLMRELSILEDDLIDMIVKTIPGVREGYVRSEGPKPYRRLDCDGRALAYIRCRPRKAIVRLDVSGLWRVAPNSRIRARSSSSAATLFLRLLTDIDEAVTYLQKTVSNTRQAYARERGPRPRPYSS